MHLISHFAKRLIRYLTTSESSFKAISFTENAFYFLVCHDKTSNRLSQGDWAILFSKPYYDIFMCSFVLPRDAMQVWCGLCGRKLRLKDGAHWQN